MKKLLVTTLIAAFAVPMMFAAPISFDDAPKPEGKKKKKKKTDDKK